MNGNCTCGVEFVEGARFCHKCGRPVDGIEPLAALAEDAPAIAPTVVVATPLLPVPPPLPVAPIGFRNRDAVRAALLSAAITFLPSSAVVQFSPLLFFGGLFIDGLLGVLLYLRRTGRGMTTIEGARQGWISGLLFFLITLVMSTLTIAVSAKGGFGDAMREQAKAQGTLTPDVAKILDQPAYLVGVMFIAMIISLILFTSLASVGGMLGARLFGSGNTNAGHEPGSKLS